MSKRNMPSTKQGHTWAVQKPPSLSKKGVGKKRPFLPEDEIRAKAAFNKVLQQKRQIKRQTIYRAGVPRSFDTNALLRYVSRPDHAKFYYKATNNDGTTFRKLFEMGKVNKLTLRIRIKIIEYLLTQKGGAAASREIRKTLYAQKFNDQRIDEALSELIDLGAVERHSPAFYFIASHWEIPKK